VRALYRPQLWANQIAFERLTGFGCEKLLSSDLAVAVILFFDDCHSKIETCAKVFLAPETLNSRNKKPGNVLFSGPFLVYSVIPRLSG
jgi:hypothetical protein